MKKGDFTKIAQFFLLLTKSQIFFGNFVRLIFLKKMIYYTLTLTYIFKVKSSIFLSIFEHESLANGLVCWNQIWYGSCLGQGSYGREKTFTYILQDSPQGRKFKKFGGAIISRFVSQLHFKY